MITSFYCFRLKNHKTVLEPFFIKYFCLTMRGNNVVTAVHVQLGTKIVMTLVFLQVQFICTLVLKISIGKFHLIICKKSKWFHIL